MTQNVFGRDYAAAYDDLYQDKDYLAECELIERIFRLYGQGAVRRVLDLGCGTGGHAIVLAQRGYQVVGVDRAPDMLERARARGTSARFELGEIGTVDLSETFDAVLMMFAVLGYQVGNADVQSALRTARRHLHAGGLLFCDFWYGPAVLAERPSERVKVVDRPNGQLIRVAAGELDPRHDLCTVRYHVWRIEDGRVVAEVREQHPMRYFFAPELELLLAATGFELVRLGAFPSFDDEANEKTWNVALVARAA
ncbi:MAG TPA: class I SAM-dependent methyltransferase [Chloroflexota bacterium]|jgi:SAM-dependent methyltransferase|nr:class I SAM-dependent methyltransferase [Chloroflexota bacterium]